MEVKNRELSDLEKQIADAASAFFRAQRDELIPRLREFEGTFPASEALREAPSESDMERIWRAVEDATGDELEAAIDEAAPEAMSLGGEAVARDVGVQASFAVGHPDAVRYLERLGARRVAGINRETRRQLANMLARAVEQGHSYQRTERAIRERFDGFSGRTPQLHISSRAELVAVTETADAYEHGQWMVREDLRERGVETHRRWLTAGDGRVCSICDSNEADGWISQDVFSSGHSRPPGHPACRCAVETRVAPQSRVGAQDVAGDLTTLTPA